jgi:hypothetical protein
VRALVCDVRGICDRLRRPSCSLQRVTCGKPSTTSRYSLTHSQMNITQRSLHICSPQSTYAGFGRVTPENVFKVCDQPHPDVLNELVKCCLDGKIDDAIAVLSDLWSKGYSAPGKQSFFNLHFIFPFSSSQLLFFNTSLSPLPSSTV